jgi:Flp pilus assembly protein TadG
MKVILERKAKQQGAVLVTVAFLLFFLLGFIGIALDFGHLFIVRTELQTAMDGCALAAAQELDGAPDAITRSTNAGLAAANANAVDLQSANWRGGTKLSAGELSWFDQNHIATTIGPNARYARCRHTQAGIPIWLMKMLGIFSGSNGSYPTTMNVAAMAEATLTPAQSTCPMPLGLKPKAGTTAPDYGYARGEWVLLLSKTDPTPGQIGWMNLDGSTTAAETEREVRGFCGTKIGDTLGTPGVKATAVDAWNSRFGLYKNSDGPSINHPDYTGFIYTAKSWTPTAGAYNDFLSKRQSFANCASPATKVNDCEAASGLKLGGGFSKVATAGTAGELRQYGANRRVVPVPVVDGGNHVTGFACMLLLQPMPIPVDDIWLEYLGNAATAGSPCTGNGLPGGSGGPRVPVLVR